MDIFGGGIEDAVERFFGIETYVRGYYHVRAALKGTSQELQLVLGAGL